MAEEREALEEEPGLRTQTGFGGTPLLSLLWLDNPDFQVGHKGLCGGSQVLP